MKRFLILIGVVSTFLFSNLLYAGWREDARFILDDHGSYTLGYPMYSLKNTKQIANKTNTSSNINTSKKPVTHKNPVKQEECRKIKGDCYQIWE